MREEKDYKIFPSCKLGKMIFLVRNLKNFKLKQFEIFGRKIAQIKIQKVCYYLCTKLSHCQQLPGKVATEKVLHEDGLDQIKRTLLLHR